MENNFDLPSPLLKPYWAILSPIFLITVRPIIPNQIGFSSIWNIFESLIILKGILKLLWTVFWTFLSSFPQHGLYSFSDVDHFSLFSIPSPLGVHPGPHGLRMSPMRFQKLRRLHASKLPSTYLKHIKEKLLPT